jgi:hypothetical protein
MESADGVCDQRLKLQYDEALSNFAFKLGWPYREGTGRSGYDGESLGLTLNPKPETLSLGLTLNPKPETLNPNTKP